MYVSKPHYSGHVYQASMNEYKKKLFDIKPDFETPKSIYQEKRLKRNVTTLSRALKNSQTDFEHYIKDHPNNIDRQLNINVKSS